jgi:hypothetical protein
VWLSDGELNVFFECKKFSHLHSVHIDFIKNKELVDDYLKNVISIPHIKKTVVMEPVNNIRKTDPYKD